MKFNSLFQHKLMLVALSYAILWASFVSSVPIDGIFLTVPGTTAGGIDGRKPELQNWLDDTETLVKAMLSAMPDTAATVDRSDQALALNLAAYFKIRVNTRGGGIHKNDVKAYEQVRDQFVQVSNFLSRSHPDLNGNLTPYLFVNSDWLFETEDVFDASGQPLKDASGIKANLRTWKPPGFDTMPDDSELKSLLLAMREGTSPSWSNYAYYSKDIADYLLEEASDRHPGNPPSFCNTLKPEDHMFGLTLERMTVDSVTICPDSFDAAKAEPFETIAEGIDSPAAKSAGSALERTSPRGLTLFHELLHLANTPDETTDSATKPTECLALVTDGKAKEARVNPDSLVFFAWSYYLTKNGDPSLKWHTGRSQQ